MNKNVCMTVSLSVIVFERNVALLTAISDKGLIFS